MSAWVEQAAFDVLCLQEVTRRIAPSPDWLIYRDPYRRLDQRADLFGDISRLLPGWLATFAPATRGLLEDAAGRPIWSEHGLACWVAPQLSVTGSRQDFVHGRFRASGWGPEPVPRAVQMQRIASGGAALVVAHLHGLRDPNGKGDTPDRDTQAASLRRQLREFRNGNETVVVAGDFNLLPDSSTFDVLAAEGLIELVTTRGHSDTRTVLYPKAQRHANYCFVSDPDRVIAFDVPATPVMSDHRPMILDLTI